MRAPDGLETRSEVTRSCSCRIDCSAARSTSRNLPLRLITSVTMASMPLTGTMPTFSVLKATVDWPSVDIICMDGAALLLSTGRTATRERPPS